MPLKKSSTNRRRWIARKGPMRRRRNQPRINRRVATRPVLVKRTISLGYVAATATVGLTFGTFQFMLADIANSSEFVNMWDRYKLCAVKLRFIPTNDNSSSTTANNAGQGNFSWVIDYNDANVPAALDDMMQYPGFKMRRAASPWTVYLKPKFETALYAGASTGYRATQGYLDTASSTVRHYGLKYCFHDTAATNQIIRVYATYYFAFKDMK